MLIVFLCCNPICDWKLRKADHTSDSILRNPRKSGNINDPRYPVYILKARNPCLIIPILQSDTTVHIATTVTGKRSTFQNGKYKLIFFSGAYFIHQIRRRNVRGILMIFHHILLGNKFVKCRIREEIHSFSCPGLRTHDRRFRTGK